MHKNLNKKTEEIFSQIGEFGRYQLFIFVLVGIIAFVPALVAYSYSFYGAVPNHRCKIPGYDNDTYEIQSDNHKELISEYIPTSAVSFKDPYDKCNLKIMNQTDEGKNYTLAKCNEWVFSKKYFESTLMADWKLVCDQTPRRSLFSTLYFFGNYGVLLSGILSDKFGRKTTAYGFIIANAILNIGISLLINLDFENHNLQQILFAILRFLTGISINVYAVAVVIAIEIVGPSKRVAAANTIYYLYIIGEYVVLLFVYFIKDYKIMYPSLTVLLVIIALYFWIVPESPRWLLAKKRNKEAYLVFKKIAESNNKKLSEITELVELEKMHRIESDVDFVPEKQYTILETLKIFFKSKHLIIRSLVIMFNWLANTFVYNGISYNTSELAGDPYVNFALSATVEMIAILASHYTLEKFGRKIPYSINMGLTGVALLIVMFIPKDLGLIVTALALVGKFAISFTYTTIYIITAESHPTVIRNSSVALCQTFSRIAAVIAPNIQLLGELYWYPLPFIVYGSFSSIAAISFIVFMPETKNKKLPDTIEEFIHSQ